MSEDKIGGKKAILEERRKKLENLRDKGIHMLTLFVRRIALMKFINYMVTPLKMI